MKKIIKMTVDDVGLPEIVVASMFCRYIGFKTIYDPRNVEWKPVNRRRWRSLPITKIAAVAELGEVLGYLRTVRGCEVVTVTLTDEEDKKP